MFVFFGKIYNKNPNFLSLINPYQFKMFVILWKITERDFNGPSLTNGFIIDFSKEYKHKIIPISTQRYKYGGVMYKSVLDITDSARHHNQGLKTLIYP